MTSPRTSQRNRHACARTIVTLQQQDGAYALLWKHYNKNNMAAALYCCCCRCILHLQQYSRRLNLFIFFFIVAPCILKSTQFTHQQIPPFINLVTSFKFTLKYTIISLLHVSVFNDHHQRALSVPN